MMRKGLSQELLRNFICRSISWANHFLRDYKTVEFFTGQYSKLHCSILQNQFLLISIFEAKVIRQPKNDIQKFIMKASVPSYKHLFPSMTDQKVAKPILDLKCLYKKKFNIFRNNRCPLTVQ